MRRITPLPEYSPENRPLIVGKVIALHVNTDDKIKRLANLGKVSCWNN